MDLKVFLSFDLPTYTFGQFQKQTYKRFTSSNIKKIFVLSNQEMRYQKGSDTIQNVSGRFDHRDRTKILHADLVRNFQASWAHQSTVSTYLGEHLKTGISLGIVLSYSIPKSFVLHCSLELCLLWPTSHFTTQILSRPNEQKVHILKSKYFN